MVNRNMQLPDSAEVRLRDCLMEQSTVFRDAVQLLEFLEGAAERRELGSPDSVAHLQKTLDRVVHAQQKVGAAYDRFKSEGHVLSDDLRRSLKSHEETLRTLIERIDTLQHLFEEIRTDLVPQLDVEARRRSMHAAYRQSLKTL